MSRYAKSLQVAIIAVMVAASAFSAFAAIGDRSDADASADQQSFDPFLPIADKEVGLEGLLNIFELMKAFGTDYFDDMSILIIDGMDFEPYDGTTPMEQDKNYVLKDGFVSTDDTIVVPQGQMLLINLGSTFTLSNGQSIELSEGASLAIGYAVNAGKVYGIGVEFTCLSDRSTTTITGGDFKCVEDQGTYTQTVGKDCEIKTIEDGETYSVKFVDGFTSRFSCKVSLYPNFMFSIVLDLNTGKMVFKDPSVGQFTLEKCIIKSNLDAAVTPSGSDMKVAVTEKITQMDISGGISESSKFEFTASSDAKTEFILNLSDIGSAIDQMIDNLDGKFSQKLTINVNESTESNVLIIDDLEITFDFNTSKKAHHFEFDMKADLVEFDIDLGEGYSYSGEFRDFDMFYYIDHNDGKATVLGGISATVYDDEEMYYFQVDQDITSEADLELTYDKTTGDISFEYDGYLDIETYYDEQYFACLWLDNLHAKGKFNLNDLPDNDDYGYQATADITGYVMGIELECNKASIKSDESFLPVFEADKLTFKGDFIPCGDMEVDKHLIGYHSVDGSATKIRITYDEEEFDLDGGPQTIDMTVKHDNGAVTKYTVKYNDNGDDTCAIEVRGGYADAIDTIILSVDKLTVTEKDDGKLLVGQFEQDVLESGTVYVGTDQIYLEPYIDKHGDIQYKPMPAKEMSLQLTRAEEPLDVYLLGYAFKYESSSKQFTLVTLDKFTDRAVGEFGGFKVDKDTRVVTFTGDDIYGVATPQTFKLKILNPDGTVYSETVRNLFTAVFTDVPKDTVYLKDSDGKIVGDVLPINGQDKWTWVYKATEQKDLTLTIVKGEVIPAPTTSGTPITVKSEAFVMQIPQTGYLPTYIFQHDQTGLKLIFNIDQESKNGFKPGDTILISATKTKYDVFNAYDIYCNGSVTVDFPASSSKDFVWHVVDGNSVKMNGVFKDNHIKVTLSDFSIYYVSPLSAEKVDNLLLYAGVAILVIILLVAIVMYFVIHKRNAAA